MNNELVPINMINDDKAIQLYKKKRKKHMLFKAILAIIFIIIALSIYFNFDEFFSHNNDANSLDTSTNDLHSTSESNTQQPQPPIQNIPSNSFEIIEESFIFSSITNQTEHELEVVEYSPKKASEIYEKFGKEAPVVLIIHSACLESYSNGRFYTQNDDFYSYKNNVRDIGKTLATRLTSLGINTIHIENTFANGGIYSSKEEFEAVLKETLKKYPSIEYVFDISRDMLINDDLTMTKPVCSINGAKAAQMKIWVGSSVKNELWKNNLSLATMLASKNPDIISEVILSSFSFSYYLCPQLLKIDIGAYSNSFDEANILANELASRLTNLIT